MKPSVVDWACYFPKMKPTSQPNQRLDYPWLWVIVVVFVHSYKAPQRAHERNTDVLLEHKPRTTKKDCNAKHNVNDKPHEQTALDQIQHSEDDEKNKTRRIKRKTQGLTTDHSWGKISQTKDVIVKLDGTGKKANPGQVVNASKKEQNHKT